MTSLINDSVALSQLLAAQAGGRLPLSAGLYACSELARLVATEHELGRTVTGLDPDHIRCTRTGSVVLGGARVHHPDTRADIQAVGGIFYQVLTGKRPGTRDVVAPSHFNPGVDSELDAVILSALAHDPSKRPATLRVLEGAMAAVFEELELSPSPEELGGLVGWVPRPEAAKPAAVAPAPVVAKPAAAAAMAAKPAPAVILAAPAPVVAAKPVPAPMAAKPAPAPVVAKLVPAQVVAKQVAAPVAKPAPAPVVAKPAPAAKPAAPKPVAAAKVPKAAGPVARPIIVRAPPAGWYASETLDEDGDYGEEIEVTGTQQVPSWQTQERERKWMVGITAAAVMIALLWALWPDAKSSRASLDNTPPSHVTARR